MDMGNVKMDNVWTHVKMWADIHVSVQGMMHVKHAATNSIHSFVSLYQRKFWRMGDHATMDFVNKGNVENQSPNWCKGCIP